LHAIEQQIVHFLEMLFTTMGWPGVVVIMGLESANIPIPSEVTMPLAGWMLAEAQGRSQLYALLAGGFYGALGCTLGSVASYYLGAWGGRPLLEKYGRYILISQHDIEWADRWFERWGEPTAFFSRLLPIVRTFISLPAGVARMPFWRFTAYTFVGSFIWCSALAWGGYLFGARWEQLRAMMRPFDIPIAIALLALFIWFLKHHIERAREPEAHLDAAAGEQDMVRPEP
jgi:membrane protein DedA with SNARE-associated domain